MRRFYSDDKNDRKRFTTQSVFSVTSIFTVKPRSSVFLPSWAILSACYRKNESTQSQEQSNPKLFPQPEILIWEKGLVKPCNREFSVDITRSTVWERR